MISALDSRYYAKLKPLTEIFGEENFVYYMSVWSIAFAECVNENAYLPHYENREELYRRVEAKERTTKHQMVALIQVLEEDYPDIQFHFGLTSEDIMHNARWTQISLALDLIQDKIKEVEQCIRNSEKQVKTPILGHTHGQPATPIKVGPYLRAKMKHLSPIRPEYRLGGSNGQLTALKFASKIEDFKSLSEQWFRKIQKTIPSLGKSEMVFPTVRVGLLQVGPSNEATIFTSISVALKMRALARALWDHCARKILLSQSLQKQAGSSAMPHKSNPVNFENAEGCFTNAYHIFLNTLEANCDSRGLRDLSNSVVNRHASDGWAYLLLGLSSLITGMSTSTYSNTAIITELRDNPECLTEILRYHIMIEEGRNDPYWELKNNPPSNLDDTLKRMAGWDVMRG